MSHIICIGALVTMIFVMPLFYFRVIDNLESEMVERELREVADSVSNSLENLYLLVSPAGGESVLRKRLDLPSGIGGSAYCVEIVHDEGLARYVRAYSKHSPGIFADSWILRGPKAADEMGCVIASDEGDLFAGCSSESTGTYVWIEGSG